MKCKSNVKTNQNKHEHQLYRRKSKRYNSLKQKKNKTNKKNLNGKRIKNTLEIS